MKANNGKLPVSGLVAFPGEPAGGSLTALWRIYAADRRFRMLIMLGCLFSLVLLLRGPQISPDSPSYFSSGQAWLAGEIHTHRTPVYPLFIGVLELLLGAEGAAWAAIVLQATLMIFTFPLYFYVSSRMLGRGWVNFAVGAFYICTPFVMGMAGEILTECFSIVGLTVFLYLMLRVFESGLNLWRALGLFLAATLISLLRPALVIVVPAMLVMCVLLLLQRRRLTAALLGVVALISGMPMVAYMYMFHQRYGVYTPTVLGDINTYFILRLNGEFNPEWVSNREIAGEMNAFFADTVQSPLNSAPYLEIRDLSCRYGIPETHKAVSEIVAAQGVKTQLLAAVKRYKYTGAQRWMISNGDNDLYKKVWYFFAPTVSTIPQLLLVWLLFAAWMVWRRKAKPYFSLFMAAYIAGNFVSSVFAAQDEWGRLCITSIPMLVILAGEMICFIRRPKTFLPQ